MLDDNLLQFNALNEETVGNTKFLYSYIYPC